MDTYDLCVYVSETEKAASGLQEESSFVVAVEVVSTSATPEQERVREMAKTRCDEIQSRTENARSICAEAGDTENDQPEHPSGQSSPLEGSPGEMALLGTSD